MQTITLPYAKDPTIIPVWHVASGLAVQRHYNDWAVVHVSSALLVCKGFASRKDAHTVQERLLALPIDWTQNANSLLRFKAQILETLTATGGTL